MGDSEGHTMESERDAARAEAEARREESKLLTIEVQMRREQYEKAEADAAILRAALLATRAYIWKEVHPTTLECVHGQRVSEQVANALSPDAGKALLERLEKAEFELSDWRECARATVAEECAKDEKHCGCVPALRMEIERLRKQCARLDKSRRRWAKRYCEERQAKEHSDSWWAERGGRLRYWVMSLPIPHEKRREFFSIVANGTATLDEHPILQQRHQILKWEADSLRAKVSELERERPSATELTDLWTRFRAAEAKVATLEGALREALPFVGVKPAAEAENGAAWDRCRKAKERARTLLSAQPVVDSERKTR